jgi:hypothetical protein
MQKGPLRGEAPGKGGFYGAGLALSRGRPLREKPSRFTMAQIRGALVCGGAHRLC